MKISKILLQETIFLPGHRFMDILYRKSVLNFLCSKEAPRVAFHANDAIDPADGGAGGCRCRPVGVRTPTTSTCRTRIIGKRVTIRSRRRPTSRDACNSAARGSSVARWTRITVYCLIYEFRVTQECVDGVMNALRIIHCSCSSGCNSETFLSFVYATIRLATDKN